MKQTHWFLEFLVQVEAREQAAGGSSLPTYVTIIQHSHQITLRAVVRSDQLEGRFMAEAKNLSNLVGRKVLIARGFHELLDHIRFVCQGRLGLHEWPIQFFVIEIPIFNKNLGVPMVERSRRGSSGAWGHAAHVNKEV